MTSMKLVALAALIASTGAFATPSDQATTTTDQTTTSTTTTKTTVPDFRSLDTNKDGIVSKDEANLNVDLAAKFDTLDADKDGSLSASEYAKATSKDHSKSKPAGSGY